MLREQWRREVQQPQVVADRCVHARMETGSCRHCVDACPRGAWVLDDQSLGLDTAACDGCGLCIPACPEGALALDRELLYLRHGAEVEVLAACEREIEGGEGVLPCLHALGIRDVLRLANRGLRRWRVAHGDCGACDRGRGARLEQVVIDLDRALAERDCPGIELETLAPADWRKRRASGAKTGAEDARSIGRRAFLRGAVRKAVETGLQPRGLLDREREEFQPPGRLLPSVDRFPAWPFVPRIDPGRCSGCDACARLCPHGAITLEETDQGPSYLLRPADCSGCGICVDVCRDEALQVLRWTPWEQAQVPLRAARCRSCGAPYHVPGGGADGVARCPVCRVVDHNRLLYQVLE